MNRFTIFTIIFSITVITVVSQLVLKEQSSDLQGSTLSSSEPISPVLDNEEAEPEIPEKSIPVTNDNENEPEPLFPSEPNPVSEPIEIYLTPEIIKGNGFTGEPEASPFSSKIFQLLDISGTSIEQGRTYIAHATGTPLASLTEIIMKGEIPAQRLYALLQNKSKSYLDFSLNETNQFGEASFYINHKRKTEEVFLIVKIKNVVYALSYVKSVHPKIQTLLSRLTDRVNQQAE